MKTNTLIIAAIAGTILLAPGKTADSPRCKPLKGATSAVYTTTVPAHKAAPATIDI